MQNDIMMDVMHCEVMQNMHTVDPITIVNCLLFPHNLFGILEKFYLVMFCSSQHVKSKFFCLPASFGDVLSGLVEKLGI